MQIIGVSIAPGHLSPNSAEIFSAFVYYAGLPDALVGLVYDSGFSAWGVIFIMVAIYLLMGCVFESLSMILLTVPVFFPVVTEISLITPPVGMNALVLCSVLNDISLATIFRGVFPFWLADIVRLALLLAFPIISVALLMQLKCMSATGGRQ